MLQIDSKAMKLKSRYIIRAINQYYNANTKKKYYIVKELELEIHNNTRKTDLVLINLREPEIIAIEIKLDKQDFINDFNIFDKKHEPVLNYCSRFYYCCPELLIDESYPCKLGIGLLNYNEAKNNIYKAVESDIINNYNQNPDIDFGFMQSILRKKRI